MTRTTIPAQALALIEKRGWWRGYRDQGGGACIVTACSSLINKTVMGLQDRVYAVIAGVIREEYPQEEGEILLSDAEVLISFNDNPATKITHLRKVLRLASRRMADE